MKLTRGRQFTEKMVTKIGLHIYENKMLNFSNWTFQHLLSFLNIRSPWCVDWKLLWGQSYFIGSHITFRPVSVNIHHRTMLNIDAHIDDIHVLYNVQFLVALTRCRKWLLRSSYLIVCLSVQPSFLPSLTCMVHTAPIGLIFMKFHIWISAEMCEHILTYIKLDINNKHFM